MWPQVCEEEFSKEYLPQGFARWINTDLLRCCSAGHCSLLKSLLLLWHCQYKIPWRECLTKTEFDLVFFVHSNAQCEGQLKREKFREHYNMFSSTEDSRITICKHGSQQNAEGFWVLPWLVALQWSGLWRGFPCVFRRAITNITTFPGEQDCFQQQNRNACFNSKEGDLGCQVPRWHSSLGPDCMHSSVANDSS